MRITALAQLAGGLLLGACMAGPVVAQRGDLPASIISAERLLHRFDFDERGTGNLEDLPRYWDVLRPTGFPRFAAARSGFDFEVGQDDSASFRLVSEGRNVAYLYSGNETPVQPGTSYLVKGYLRAAHAPSARARLSALYLDERGRPLIETMVSSNPVGEVAESAWQSVELTLGPAPVEAATVGLIAWLLQEAAWDTTQRPRRHIDKVDVAAIAWFDSIVIHALPRIAMSTSSPGNVLAPGRPQDIEVLLSDYLDASLTGVVRVRTADGTVVATHTAPVSLGGLAEPQRFSVAELPPGLYEAELTVLAAGEPVTTRRFHFARLAEVMRKTGSLARPFGVIVGSGPRATPDAEYTLLHEQLARSAKLPLWSGRIEHPPTVDELRERNQAMQALLRDGFALTGVFAGSPSRLVESAGAYPRPLVAVLSEDPGAWKTDLADVLAPNASYFRWWQLGADGDRGLAADERLTAAVDNLREQMRPFMNTPLLAATAHSLVERAGEPPEVQQLTLTLSASIAPHEFEDAVAPRRAEGHEQLAVYVEPLPEGGYEPAERLTDWAARMLLARHAGADTVYAAQTWDVAEGVGGLQPEPRPEYLVLRTISDLVADATPAGRLPVAPGVVALVFQHAETSVVAMWDPEAPAEGRECTVQLGAAREQVDLWGQRMPLQRNDRGQHVVRLTRRPVLIPGVERWLTEFVIAARLAPDHVEFGARDHAHEFTFRNAAQRHLAGAVRVVVPERWDVVPNSFDLSVGPGSTQSARVELTYPHTEPAGDKTIMLELTLSQSGYRIDIPLALSVGLSDIEAWALPIIEGDDLVLRHVVTNRSTQVLHFRGSAVVPGKPRQYQPFSNLLPGETTMTEYRFKDGAALAGRSARLMLRELNDGSRIHNIEVAIP